MSKDIRKGNELQLFINGSTAPCWATSHTLTLTGNSSEVNTKDHGLFASNDTTSLSWELTGEFLYSTTDFDTMFDYYVSAQPVMIKFAKVKNFSTQGLTRVGGDVVAWIPDDKSYRQGYALITSLTTNANAGENATYSITFTGTGALRHVDMNPTQYYVKNTHTVTTNSKTIIYRSKKDYPVYIDGELITPLKDTIYSYSYIMPESSGELDITTYFNNDTVPAHMFENLTGLHYSDYNTMGYFGSYSFAGNDGFQNRDITSAITIEDGAFFNCDDIQTMDIGSSCTSIGAYAFARTTLGSIAFSFESTHPCSLGEWALGDPSQVQTIVVPRDTAIDYQTAWPEYASAIEESDS